MNDFKKMNELTKDVFEEPMKYERVSMGGVVMEARFYTFTELREILSTEKLVLKHLEQAMKEEE